MMVMENAVANHWGQNKPGCSQQVRNGIDILMGCNRECLFQNIGNLARWICRRGRQATRDSVISKGEYGFRGDSWDISSRRHQREN